MRRLVLRAVLTTALAVVGVTVVMIAARPSASDQAEASAETPRTAVIFPSPGASSASPRSEISLRGVDARAARGIVVSGSRSGPHPGRLEPHADGAGVSFVPSQPFDSGERVRVRVPAGLRVSGGNGRIAEFTTARIVPGPATTGQPEPHDSNSFPALKSRPGLAPPPITVKVSTPGQGEGSIFIAPKRGPGQSGPMIVDDRGRPIWFKPINSELRATDFRVQEYRGNPVLTWWQGRGRGGSGRGVGVIADASYRTIRTVRAGNGLAADLHEFVLTGRGSALFVSYVPVRRNLAAVGGPRDGIAVDGVAQEVELSTGRVLFEWHSLDHVPLSHTDLPRPVSGNAPFDYFHINSFNVDPDGGYVVSGRHSWMVLKLDSKGDVRWRLGGKGNTLRRGPGTHFRLQHDAIGHGDGMYTIFDNSAEGVRKASRAITVKVDPAKRTATLVRSIRHPDNVLAATQGNVQTLPGGHMFVGWGSQGRASEFTRDGRLVLDLTLPRGYDSYRAYRFPWTGRPLTSPAVAATRSGTTTTVYASWNGSTETASWNVLTGASAASLRPAAAAARSGLETQIRLPGSNATYVAVEARDRAGTTLARSPAVRVRTQP